MMVYTTSLERRGFSERYSSKASFTLRTSASTRAESTDFVPRSAAALVDASRKRPLESSVSSLARYLPSTSTLTSSSETRSTCFTSATTPYAYRSLKPGSSTSISCWAVKKTALLLLMAHSMAAMDFLRPTSKWMIFPGNTTRPRSAMAGRRRISAFLSKMIFTRSDIRVSPLCMHI